MQCLIISFYTCLFKLYSVSIAHMSRVVGLFRVLNKNKMILLRKHTQVGWIGWIVSTVLNTVSKHCAFQYQNKDRYLRLTSIEYLTNSVPGK